MRAAQLRGRSRRVVPATDPRTLAIFGSRDRRPGLRHRGELVRPALVATDLLWLSLSFTIAQLVAGGGATDGSFDRLMEFALFALTLPAWILVTKLYGLYAHDEARSDHTTADDFVGVFHVATVGSWLFFAGAWITGLADPEILKVLLFWMLGIVLVTLGRALTRAFCRRRIAYLQNAVIVGAGDVGQLLARKILRHPEYGINLVGFVDAAPKQRADVLGHVAVLGSPGNLPSIVGRFDIERILVAFSNESHERTLELIRSLKNSNVRIDIVPRFFEIFGSRVDIHTLEGLPLLGLPSPRLPRSSSILKRSLDLVGAGLALSLLAPLFAVVALLIKLESSGPVFFRQVRRGAGERMFEIYKFRTMSVDADERKGQVAHLNKHLGAGGSGLMFKIPNDPRITRVGVLLRRHSLDELPQLINVLKGEMSLVGPRPLILDEDQHVRDWARHRLNLKPGMTGYWQVLGNSDIPFEEMVGLDYVYVTSWSLFSDLKLLFRTIPVVLRTRETC
ncbi:MAG: sugar transferase [Gaiellaceae bacterium]